MRRILNLNLRATKRNFITYNVVHNKWARPADLILPHEIENSNRKRNNRSNDRNNDRNNNVNNNFNDKNIQTNRNNKGPATTSAPTTIVDEIDESKINKKMNNKKSKKSNRSSLLNASDDNDEQYNKKSNKKDKQSQVINRNKKGKDNKKPSSNNNSQKLKRQVFIPSVISVANLSRIFNVKLDRLQRTMLSSGIDNVQFDRMLTSEDASLLAYEFNYEPVLNEEKAFDLYPSPPHPDLESLPLRPPIVTIMGHVDHGKTTLLDQLRSTSVAKSEAGGITQHIGAFSIPINGNNKDENSLKSITFLDTPGHAAFTNMRARGASVTDIVVLVVAADDGVMPQTKEVIDLVQKHNLDYIVAINKCDKPGVDATKIKYDLLANNVTLEEFGGDIPSIEISALNGQGLEQLLENLSVLSEVKDLKAESNGRAHGIVLESRVDKGKGNIATVLVTRGELKSSSCVVGGVTWGKVRQMEDDKSNSIKVAKPGQPVLVAGWKELPKAGDEVLEAENGEDEAKRAVNNRLENLERLKAMSELEIINEKRKHDREVRNNENVDDDSINKHNIDDDSEKFLNIIVKGDVSGTVEAFIGALEGIGNDKVKVKVVSSGVGDINESDLTRAIASEASVIGFNVKATKSIQNSASMSNIKLLTNSVIYKLLDDIRQMLSGLLPSIIEKKVLGEGSVLQIFDINIKGRQFKKIGGCRIVNGNVTKQANVRVLRNEEVIYEG